MYANLIVAAVIIRPDEDGLTTARSHGTATPVETYIKEYVNAVELQFVLQ